MPYVSNIQSYVRLTRPENASGSVLTYCIGYFLLANAPIDSELFIGLGILLALHSLATVQNDIEDFEIDRANKRKSALQDNLLSLSQARFFVIALGFVAVILATLSPHRKLHLLAVAGLLLTAWLYNLTPIRASKKPVMSISLLGLCYGALPFVYGYAVARGHITSYFVALAFLWFLARFSTAVMKDYKDVAGDKVFNKKTFYLRYGRKMTAWISIALALIAYLGVIALLIKLENKNTVSFAALVLAGLLAMRSLALRFALIKTKDEKRLNGIFHKSVFSHNQFEAAILLCLILS